MKIANTNFSLFEQFKEALADKGVSVDELEQKETNTKQSYLLEQSVNDVQTLYPQCTGGVFIKCFSPVSTDNEIEEQNISFTP